MGGVIIYIRDIDKQYFSTERCFVRNFILDDLDGFIEYRNNKTWMQYQGFTGLTKTEYAEYLLKVVDFTVGSQLAIIDKLSNNLIGDIYVKQEKDIFWIGYTISPNFKRLGYAYEVTSELINWINRNFSVDIMAGVEPNNIPSIELLKKLGFSFLKEDENELIFKYVSLD